MANISEFTFIFNLILSFMNATVDIDSEEEKEENFQVESD